MTQRQAKTEGHHFLTLVLYKFGQLGLNRRAPYPSNLPKLVAKMTGHLLPGRF